MFAWIERFFQRKKFTVAAAGTLSDERDFRNCYPTRIFVENTTNAPTALTFQLVSPVDDLTFVDLYSGGSALSITVVVNKWNAIPDDIAKLIGCERVKVGCAAWSAGGRVWFDTCT